MKRLIKSIFAAVGLEIRKRSATATLPAKKAPVKTGVNSMEAGMQRAATRHGIHPNTIIDLGAAEGTWTEKAIAVWPDANYILFEPLEERKIALDALHAKHPRVTAVYAAAGNKSGSVQFQVSEDLDGSGIYDSESKGGNREVRLTTIDEELNRLSASAPFVLKFDTHGFEIPILEGAGETLKNTELIIMECYGYRLSDQSLLFGEMCAYLAKQGFYLSDIIEVMRRPGDEAFWQCDAFFVREGNAIRTKKTYQ